MQLQFERFLLAYHTTYNAFFMVLLSVSFIFADSQFCGAYDGFFVFFIVATLIIEVLFEQFSIHTAV